MEDILDYRAAATAYSSDTFRTRKRSELEPWLRDLRDRHAEVNRSHAGVAR